MQESTVVDEWDGEGPGPLGYTEARLQALWPQVPGQAGPLAQPDGRCRLLRALVAACNQGCITMQASLLHPIDTSVPPGGPANGAACQLHAVRVSITLLPSFWDQDLQLQQQPGGRDPLDAAAGFLRVDLLQLLAASAATAGPSSSGAEGPSSPAAGAGATANRAVEGVDDVRDDVFQMLNCGWAAEVADPPGLRCSLYRYQRRALAWMCWRELEGSCPGGSSSSSSESAAVAQGAALHPPAADPAWTAVTLPAGGSAAVCYCNALEGRVSRAPPAAMRRPPGGILADEMGLGKTVEVSGLAERTDCPAA